MHRVALPAAIVLALSLTVAAARPAAAGTSIETQLFRGAAIGLAVSQAAKPLNSFINTLTLRRNMPAGLGTKVVPIVSVGEKGYVGGAQVSGPAHLVKQVSAVFQYEKNFDRNNYRAKVLLPSGSYNPLEFKRVPKVGITAIIDVSVDGHLRYHTVSNKVTVGDVVRNAAVVVAVKNAGPTINQAVNTFTFNKGEATKVVPMGSLGDKAYIGAAQVSASANTIGKARAVWQYEGLFGNGVFRVKAMVPAMAINPIGLRRVEGAGITAVIDMAVQRQKSVQEARPSFPYPVPAGDYRPTWDSDRRDDKWKADRRDDDDDDRGKKNGRHDNGKHKGWYKGKHKGWYKNGKAD